MARSRSFGAIALLACLAALAVAWARAPDLPDGAPIARVDAALLERLRASPGLHLPLAKGWVLLVPLELREDRLNRRLFRTDVDLREAVPRLAIHVQEKGGRAAIHADRWNPLDGPRGFLLHNTIDAPAVPLLAGLAAGGVLLARRRRRG